MPCALGGINLKMWCASKGFEDSGGTPDFKIKI